MDDHVSDWRLWQFRQNLLNKQEQNKIRRHLVVCPDCMWDLINLDVVEKIEETDRRGKLLELNEAETTRLINLTCRKKLTG
ncbi:MAG: hypothetical protein LBC74_11970 [Planctomycetaceae bacterium]|nr:hypothetical protein [Planctomycetaceae bacterium]